MGAFFSVVVPVFNKAGTLDNCINSLKEQTCQDFEVIFVNDGSTDNSVNEILEKTAGDNRFRIVEHEKNESVSVARFTGMDAAKGEYLFFMDADDAFDVHTFEEIKEFVKANPVDIVRYNFITKPGDQLGKLEECENPVKEILLGTIPPAVWRNCYSKRVYEASRKDGERFYSNMGEDMYLATILFSNAKVVKILDRPFYFYDTSTGMSSTKAGGNIEKLLRDKKNVDNVASHLISYGESHPDIEMEWVNKCNRDQYRFILAQQLDLCYEDEVLANKMLDCFADEQYKEVREFGEALIKLKKARKES